MGEGSGEQTSSRVPKQTGHYAFKDIRKYYPILYIANKSILKNSNTHRQRVN